MRYDDGYGCIGNPIYYLILNELLDDKSGKLFRDELKNDDKDKYEYYLKYEKIMRIYE